MLLTVREAAVLLKATERQLYRWVDEGEVPFRRVRDQVRFNRTDLMEWATNRGLAISVQAFDADEDPEDVAPSLAEALRRGGVHPDLRAQDRESVLRGLVEVTPLPAGVDPEFLVDVLIARENSCSTAIGDGIATPHVRQPIVAPGSKVLVSVAYLQQAVLFGAPNGKQVTTVFLIVSPTIREHLQVLAHLARALLDADFHAAVLRREPAEALAACAARLEAPTPCAGPEGGAG